MAAKYSLAKVPKWAWWTGGATLLAFAIPLVAFAYENGKISKLIFLSRVEGILMRADIARKFLEMKVAAARDGIDLKVNSGFRTMTEQLKLWLWSFTPGAPQAAKPGYSNHQNGRALDFDTGGNNPISPQYKWLAANASKWGFTNVGKTFAKPEYWHWEVTT